MSEFLVPVARVILVAVLLAIGGCQSSFTPPPEVLAKAEYGSPVIQSSAQDQADAYLKTALKDPESRRVTWGVVERGYEETSGANGDWMLGYKMTASVNAKSSYGGYAGAKPYVFFFQDAKLKAVYTTMTKVGRSMVYDVYARVY